jgi:redox-regulated HSP33 family molecular chaperone
MMGQAVKTSPRLWARIAGGGYLITIIMGVFAEVFVRGTVVVRDTAAATATNILAHESLYRCGLAADSTASLKSDLRH